MISKLIPIDYNKLEQCIKADDHMFKESSEHSCLPSWCNGIAGQILARVIGYEHSVGKRHFLSIRIIYDGHYRCSLRAFKIDKSQYSQYTCSRPIWSRIIIFLDKPFYVY